MGMSDKIESFILELLKSDDDWLEIGRNELATVFNCVPSQINYVISTRFNPDRGYMVESKRGGGGYLRIRRLATGDDSLIYQAAMRIGDSIDYPTARSVLIYLLSIGEIDENMQKLMLSATDDKSIGTVTEQRDSLRARILKNMLLSLI